jgi:probable F420-dependent oxidoreductase
MTLPLEKGMKVGIFSPLTDRAQARATTELTDQLGYDSLWVGDHLIFTGPIGDPLTQLAMAAAFSDRLLLGTGVYLLPLRHPTAVAKQVSTLDRLCDGRLLFGVGVGGEFPVEFEAVGVPVNERGARLGEGITVLKKYWSGETVNHDGPFYPLPQAKMEPAPAQPGGPPVWCGGRAPAALARAGRQADGYISYVVTPDMFRASLDTISQAAEEAGREVDSFGTGHLFFARIDDSYEAAYEAANARLSSRYAMDFSKATERYVALGRAEDVAAKVAEYYDAGVRHIVYDCVSEADEYVDQRTRFAEEVLPLLPGR